MARQGGVTFWVYENWRARGHQSRAHTGDCPHCNEGQGVSGHGTRADNGQWHGPFATFAAADALSQRLPGPAHRCRVCSPSD